MREPVIATRAFFLAILVTYCPAACSPSPSLQARSDDVPAALPDEASLDTLTPLADPPVIYCFHAIEENLPTTVDGCRPGLNDISKFDDYKLVQPFVEGTPRKVKDLPQKPHPPPYVITNDAADCSIKITPYVMAQTSWFSFREARALAQNILQHCEDKGLGRGGSAPIGKTKWGESSPLWSVTVVGKAKLAGGDGEEGGGGVIVS